MATRGYEKALSMLKTLPRVGLFNIAPNPGFVKPSKRGRGQHGGDKHGAGNKGSKARQNYMRTGYETSLRPYYLSFTHEPYYLGHHLKRQYPPLSLGQLQLMIDTDRINAEKPIDLVQICNTGLYKINPQCKHYGVHLTDEGADSFKAKVNIEVQWATEPVIAAVERNGGTITTAFFDPPSLFALTNVKKFLESGEPIPKRMIPPEDAISYYTDPKMRGYLADPDQVSWERLVLAQKYGYSLPKIEEDPNYEMLTLRKDPRQIFYGLEPGWVVNLIDRIILKPTDPELQEYYKG
ncbi:39S ribosomal protein L15, mitochondrial [Frankliniella fusca]|uniref:Large ribosomal subunit protein uL15m n=1 Tax=Frankliniella fusca TaxID=407009 RepID=A0AAE1I351_9NEOP|nr:39S ribosomal protein L15, mitochondrial [Frankliniella fusca]